VNITHIGFSIRISTRRVLRRSHWPSSSLHTAFEAQLEEAESHGCFLWKLRQHKQALFCHSASKRVIRAITPILISYHRPRRGPVVVRFGKRARNTNSGVSCDVVQTGPVLSEDALTSPCRMAQIRQRLQPTASQGRVSLAWKSSEPLKRAGLVVSSCVINDVIFGSARGLSEALARAIKL